MTRFITSPADPAARLADAAKPAVTEACSGVRPYWGSDANPRGEEKVQDQLVCVQT